jgi:hypothetical protein
VEIDLNGFTLAGGSIEPVIAGNSVAGLHVHDGSITGGNPGVFFESASDLVIENVRVVESSGVGIHLLETCNYQLRRCIVSAGEQAILASAAYGCPGRIEKNWITGSGGSATTSESILVQGGSGTTLTDNRLTGFVHGIGIHLVACHECVVSRNVLEDFGSDALSPAIKVESSTVGRVADNFSSEAIELVDSDGIEVDGNVVLGIFLDDGCESNAIRRNSVERFTGSYGVRVDGDRNLIEENVLNDKPGYGLFFSASAEQNVFRANVARGCSGSGGCSGTGTTDFCDEGTGNTSGGDNFMPARM